MGTVSAAGDGAMNFTLNTIENVADWRHSGGLNALFLDGHVSLFHRNESEQLNSYVNNFAR
jgi:prepilin-type processing-associated H-X9-DG protein